MESANAPGRTGFLVETQQLPRTWLTEKRAWIGSRGVILLSLVLHLLFCWQWSDYDLAQDEAHYWDWSRHLDWSYYSKGPLVAWIIAGSTWVLGDLAQSWTGSMTAAVRTPAVIFGTLLIWCLVRLGEVLFQSKRLGLLIAVSCLCIPPIAAVSTIMTIDSPYTCSWAAALLCAWWALNRPGWLPWVILGVIVGLGILAKYTMVVFFPSLGLFLLFRASKRRHLIEPGLWISALVALLCITPILYWNYLHAGVTFKHVGNLAGVTHDQTKHLLGPLKYLGEQAALLLGYWFVLWFWAMIEFRPGRPKQENEQADGIAYLWWMSAPMFLLFFGFSIRTGGGEVNWPVAAYLAGLPLALHFLAARYREGTPRFRAMTAGFLTFFLGLGLALTLIVHKSDLVYPLMIKLLPAATEEDPAPLRRLDPVCRLRGWKYLATQIDVLRDELSASGKEPILAATHWSIPGELGFYCQGHPQAYSIGPLAGDRHSQYDLWKNPVDHPEVFLGRDFIIVGGLPKDLHGSFAQVLPSTQVRFEMPGGYIITNWPVQVARGFKGFPKAEKPERSF